MMTEYKSKVAELTAQIIEQDYFINLWTKILARHNFVDNVNMLNSYTDEQVCLFLNDFWHILPDNSTIRRDPFWLLCDLSEGTSEMIFPDDLDDPAF